MTETPLNTAAKRWTLVRELFDHLVDLSPEERVRFLDEQAPIAAVRAEVMQLITALQSAESLFDSLSGEIGTLTGALPRLEAGDILNERFRILRFLAQGGMGEVYEAEDLELGGKVAIKTVRAGIAALPTFLQRFRDEIRLSRSINSPFVCRVHDVARDGELIYFSMELLPGETLAQRIDRCGALTVEEARPLIHQMAVGLNAAHELGIVHRDFKSANVMLCPAAAGQPARAVITDFGLSLAMSATGNAGRPAASGTPAYIAPEQLTGDPESPATDIYSFGAVLYEMLTGAVPFPDVYTLDDARQRLDRTPVPPRKLKPHLKDSWDAAVMRCLAPDQAQRFESTLDVSRAMHCDPQQLSGFNRRRWLRTAAAATAVPIAGGGAWWSRRDRTLTTLAPSIAVLPFRAGDASGQFLADGIADRLTDALTKVPGLRVISRSAAQQFESKANKVAGDARARARSAGDGLKVRYLFSGKVTQAGQKIRVASEIVDASTGDQVWAGTQDVDAAEAELVSTRLSTTAIHALNIDALPADLSAMERPLTKDAEAYRLYLLGRYQAAGRSKDSAPESVAFFERAVKKDPKFAAAWSALGNSYVQLGFRMGLKHSGPMSQAMDAAQRSIELDPTRAEGHMVAAQVKQWDLWDLAGAETEFRKAIELEPQWAHGHRLYALLLSFQGKLSEAEQRVAQAAQFDPLNPAVKVLQGIILTYQKRFEEANRLFSEVVAADPDFQNAYVPWADALEQSGRVREAIAASERVVSLSQRASYSLCAAGRLYARSGKREEALGFLDELKRRYSNGEAQASEIAPVYLALGMKSEAFEWLEKAFFDRSMDLIALKVAAEYEAIRSEPRFRMLLDRLKFD